MTGAGIKTGFHPSEAELSDYLSGILSGDDKKKVEDHIACCRECLTSMVSAYESVKESGKTGAGKKRKGQTMKKPNIYLILAIVSFILSFIIQKYFIQFLTATLLLGIKWVADAKSTKMLVMIYEAWKNGGEKEASRILKTLDQNPKNRL